MITKDFETEESLCLVTFSVRLPASVRQVSVVGDFNGWTPSAHPLQKSAPGRFSAAIPLPTGHRYQFKYLCDHGHWHNEEAADAYQSNEYGQVNSVLVTIRPGQSGKAPISEPKLVKKAPPKKAVAIEKPANKAPAKKAAPKVAPAKVAEKPAAAAPAKKAPAKKAAAKKAPKP